MTVFNEYAKTTELDLTLNAFFYIHLDLTEKGLSLHELAYEEDRSKLLGIKCDFVFDPVRDNPQFKAFMNKIGLTED